MTMKPVHPRKRKNHSQAESRKQLCEEMMLGLFVFLVRISVKKKNSKSWEFSIYGAKEPSGLLNLWCFMVLRFATVNS